MALAVVSHLIAPRMANSSTPARSTKSYPARRRRRRHRSGIRAISRFAVAANPQRAHARSALGTCVRLLPNHAGHEQIFWPRIRYRFRRARRHLRRRRKAHRARTRDRLVSQSHGIRPASARQSQHPGRPRTSRDARPHQRNGEDAEAFRPFAPACSVEQASRWFNVPEGTHMPYMITVVDVRPEHNHFLPSLMSTARRVCRPSRRKTIPIFTVCSRPSAEPQAGRWC